MDAVARACAATADCDATGQRRDRRPRRGRRPRTSRAALGIATAVVPWQVASRIAPPSSTRSREAIEAQRARTRRAGGLHAHPVAGVRRSATQGAAQHPSLAAAEVPRAAHAPRVLEARRRAARRQRALRHGGTRRRAGRSAIEAHRAARRHARSGFQPRSGDGAHHLSRVSLGWIAAGRLAWRDGRGLARRRAARRAPLVEEFDDARCLTHCWSLLVACGVRRAWRGADRRRLKPFKATYDVEWRGMSAGTSSSSSRARATTATRYSARQHARAAFSASRFPMRITQTSDVHDRRRQGHAAELRRRRRLDPTPSATST